eukprot:g3498.t1
MSSSSAKRRARRKRNEAQRRNTTSNVDNNHSSFPVNPVDLSSSFQCERPPLYINLDDSKFMSKIRTAWEEHIPGFSQLKGRAKGIKQQELSKKKRKYDFKGSSQKVEESGGKKKSPVGSVDQDVRKAMIAKYREMKKQRLNKHKKRR